jgi:hypothetical protein
MTDTLLDRAYNREGNTELMGSFWSGKYGCAVNGVRVVSRLCTGRGRAHAPQQEL